MSDTPSLSPGPRIAIWIAVAGLVAVTTAVCVVHGPSRAAPYGIAMRGEAPPYLGMPAEPVFPRSGNWTTEVAYPNITFRNPLFLEPEPGTRRLIAGELEGRIYAIDGDDMQTHEKRLLLDLSAHTQGGWDSGLLGLAFHPDYARADSPNRGFIYVFYSWAEEPVLTGRPPENKETRTRVSRFKVDPATGVINPGSEQILMSQKDVNIYHAGSGVFFHPKDGFLYVSFGDEGGARDFRGNSQKINKSLFSGVMRIDVDQRGGAISHPIRNRPIEGETDHYFIPNDNPFVGVPGALEEFFAIGLRNPHRMTYDPVDNLAWIGDIGQSAMEEISVLEFDRGPLNFQWNIREGTKEGFAEPGSEKNALGIWTDPIFAYGRDQGRSIIGGYVYRGTRYPSLQGKYLFGDFGSGRIWALTYVKGAPPRLRGVELLAHTANAGYNYRDGEGGLTSFGRNRDGEPYLLYHGLYTHIARLVEAKEYSGNIPALLSQTGVFADLKTLQPASGLVPYDVNLAAWMDGVPARRWISVPTGKTIAFNRSGPWTFPPGTVLVQHFEVADPGSPEGPAKRLETRLLVAAANSSFYAVGYRWNADGSDAEMVTSDTSQSVSVPVKNARPRSTTWNFTLSEGCRECHSREAGYVLGVKSSQLNFEFTYPGGAKDQQLRTWAHLGLLDRGPGRVGVAQLDRLARPDDESRSVEDRVRSYLDANCSHCHGAKPIRAAWNGNFAVPLRQQGILFGQLVGENSGAGFHVVAPRDLTGSMLYQRAATDDVSTRMPPAGPQLRNDAFVKVLRQWIEGLPREETAPPQVARVRRRGDAEIEAVFSEALRSGTDGAGAGKAENFRLSGGARVLSATLKDDLRTIVLATTPLQAGQAYTLTVTNVTDRADKPNRIPDDTVIAVP